MSLYRLTHHFGRRELTSSSFSKVRMLTASPVPESKFEFAFPEDASPQGVQGSLQDDCPTFGLWLDNCRRYGLENCNQQLQGIQTGRKTIAEVMEEQERLITEIAEKYRSNIRLQDVQGVQEDISVLPDINMPCPQGIQGDDCERFKLWLENCHRFGFANCMQQLHGFHHGRKTLPEIFEEQDRAIREAASVLRQQRRKYTTSTRHHQLSRREEMKKTETSSKTEEVSEMETGKDGQEAPSLSDNKMESALTYRQKLQRAVKEYGSTVMVFHITISLMSLGFFYVLVDSGVDVVGILNRIGIGGDTLKAKIASGTGTFVIAYAVHKVFAPARIAATLTATPLIVRYLRRIGFLKAPTSKA